MMAGKAIDDQLRRLNRITGKRVGLVCVCVGESVCVAMLLLAWVRDG